MKTGLLVYTHTWNPGGWVAIREGPIQLRKIAKKLRKNCEKLRKHCDAATKPPEASRSDTSAQVAQNVSVSSNMVHRHHNYCRRPSISPCNSSMTRRRRTLSSNVCCNREHCVSRHRISSLCCAYKLQAKGTNKHASWTIQKQL